MIPGNIFTGLSETSTDIYNQMRWRDYEFYAGDSWKVNRKLTLDLGVRYSMLLTPYQVNGLMTSFNPNLYNPAGSAFDACNGLWVVPGKSPCTQANTTFGRTGDYAFSAGTPGPNKYLKNQNYHLFAPRLGIAYDVFGDGKTALRAGIGQFFQRDRSAIYTMSANAPFALNASGKSRTLDGPSLYRNRVQPVVNFGLGRSRSLQHDAELLAMERNRRAQPRQRDEPASWLCRKPRNSPTHDVRHQRSSARPVGRVRVYEQLQHAAPLSQ